MNARERIAYVLWQVMPSEGDAEARAAAAEMLGAYRAEVLNEAAGILRTKAASYPSRRIFAAGLRHGALMIAKLATGRGTTAPDFFQPGRTYADQGTDWKFRCDAVTTRPDDGERTALGWRHFRGEWEPYAYDEGDWDIHQHVGHTDVTEAGAS